MNARDFVYWLQGYMEIADPKEIDQDTLDMIKRHLRLTFYHDLEPGKEDEEPNSKPKPKPRQMVTENELQNLRPGNGRTMIKC